MSHVVWAEPNGFIGDPSTLTGRAAVVQVRVDEDSEILRIPAERFRHIVVEDSELSDLILKNLPRQTEPSGRGRLRVDPGDRIMASFPLPRVYAVGDVRAGSVKRVASAVGEGSVVVQFIHRALNEG